MRTGARVSGAGDGIRTREYQHGKLGPYHLATPARVFAGRTGAGIVYRASFRGTRHRRRNEHDPHENGSCGDRLNPAHVAVRQLRARRRYVPDIEVESVRRGRVAKDDRDGLDVLSVGEVESSEGMPERIWPRTIESNLLDELVPLVDEGAIRLDCIELRHDGETIHRPDAHLP